MFSYSFYLAAAGYLLVPLSQDAGTLAAVAFVFGLGIGCCAPLTMILMFSRSTQGRSGETLGLRLTTNNLRRVIGPVLFCLVATGLGLVPVFAVSAAVMAAGGVLSRPRTP